MKCIEFSETREERKYYEGKKQKALREIDKTLNVWSNQQWSDTSEGRVTKTAVLSIMRELMVIKKMVNDI